MAKIENLDYILCCGIGIAQHIVLKRVEMNRKKIFMEFVFACLYHVHARQGTEEKLQMTD